MRETRLKRRKYFVNMLLLRNAEVEPVTFISTMRLYLKIISCSRACAQLPIYRASLINVGTNVVRDLIHLWLLLVPTKMDLTCVVRRDIKLLSKRKCNFSDAVFHSSQSVDIFPDRELTASFTIAKNKEIGVQCQACDISALHVSLFSKHEWVFKPNKIFDTADQYGMCFDRESRSLSQRRRLASRRQSPWIRSNGSLSQENREGWSLFSRCA